MELLSQQLFPAIDHEHQRDACLFSYLCPPLHLGLSPTQIHGYPIIILRTSIHNRCRIFLRNEQARKSHKSAGTCTLEQEHSYIVNEIFSFADFILVNTKLTATCNRWECEELGCDFSLDINFPCDPGRVIQLHCVSV